MQQTNVNKYIGEKIKYYRTKKNLTQLELGEYLGITSQTISRYESGILETNQDVLFRLAEFFNISINEFFPTIHHNRKENDSECVQDLLEQYKVLFDKDDRLTEEQKKFFMDFLEERHKRIDEKEEKGS